MTYVRTELTVVLGRPCHRVETSAVSFRGYRETLLSASQPKFQSIEENVPNLMLPNSSCSYLTSDVRTLDLKSSLFLLCFSSSFSCSALIAARSKLQHASRTSASYLLYMGKHNKFG